MYWGLYLAPPILGSKPDLGIAVAKKLAKRAVDRNRLKRMIRETMRRGADPKNDAVVKLKKPIGRETRGRLRKHEQDILRKQILDLI